MAAPPFGLPAFGAEPFDVDQFFRNFRAGTPQEWEGFLGQLADAARDARAAADAAGPDARAAAFDRLAAVLAVQQAALHAQRDVVNQDVHLVDP